MHNQLILEKIKQAAAILHEQDIDLWLIFTRESASLHDPSLDSVVGTNVTWPSAHLIHRSGDTTAIVGSLDAPNMKLTGTFTNVVGYVQSVKQPLLSYLQEKNPKRIAINYSVNSNLADGLTHGMYLMLMDIVQGTPWEDCFISSETIIASLRGKKSAAEIANMQQAINITEEIFDAVTGYLKPGISEKDVAAFILGKVKEKGLEPAWDPDHCPAVFTGPDTAGAHSGPTDRLVERGHILNIDFGVRYNGYCSDLQRTWYILREGEAAPPAEVLRGFTVLRDSISNAKAVIKPGVQGCTVDDAARGHITANGYAEYQHGLGHQVGRVAHDGGAGLFPRWERYGNLPYLPLEVNQVFTIEPRLMVEGHGIVTMEEMVAITPDGCEYLSHPQTELWVIQ